MLRKHLVAPVLALGAIAILLASCAVPFTTETETTAIEIPISPSVITGYKENRVELPSEARRDGVRYETVRLHYTATTDSGLEADVEIWISEDQETNGTKDDENDDKIVDIRLSSGETKSGETESDAHSTRSSST